MTDGSSTATVQVSGDIRALDTGQPLKMSGCGPGGVLAMPADRSHVSVPAAGTFLVDHLVLNSPAPAPALPSLATSAVITPGKGGVDERKDIKLRVGAPSWLVLAETYSRGWHAWCKNATGKERALGAATPVDGFANGWRVDQSCAVARVSFTPQSMANLGYWISAIGGVLLLLVALVGFVLRRGTSLERGGVRRVLLDDPPVRLTPPVAIAPALALGVICGFVFALRVGVLVTPVAFGALVTGVTVRRLLAFAGAALILIPLVYILIRAELQRLLVHLRHPPRGRPLARRGGCDLRRRGVCDQSRSAASSKCGD